MAEMALEHVLNILGETLALKGRVTRAEKLEHVNAHLDTVINKMKILKDALKTNEWPGTI